MDTLDRTAEWLSNNDVGVIKYTNRPPPHIQGIDYFAELRAGYIARGEDPAGVLLFTLKLCMSTNALNLVLDAEEEVWREFQESKQKSSLIAKSKVAAEDSSLGKLEAAHLN